MIVDDENGPPHVTTVAEDALSRIGAAPEERRPKSRLRPDDTEQRRP
jgi:hypothetical protein